MQNLRKEQSASYESILKAASKKSKGVFSIKRTYPAYILLIVLIALSFVTWNLAGELVNSSKTAQFEKASNSIMTRLDTKFQRKKEVIMSMSGLYDILVQVVKDYFELYGTVPSKTYPSILSFTYAPQIENKNLEEFVFNARSQGYYDYKVHPEGDRDFYYLVEHIVPLSHNYHRLGYDLGTNPSVKSAIENARDNNILTSTPTFDIRSGDTTGFYLISPIYERESARENVQDRRANFAGVVLLEIESKSYYDNALDPSENEEKGKSFPTDSSVIFKIYDVDDKGNENIIYTSNNAGLLENDYIPDLKESLYYNLADRTLRVDFQTIPGFGGKFQQILPLLSFAIALIISFASFGFVLSVLTAKSKAQDLAERMTLSQRRIVDSSKDIIAVLDFNGNWKSMNPASFEILGYEQDEMQEINLEKIIYDPADWKKLKNDIESSKGEFTERIDIQMLDKNSNVKWLNWSFTISHYDNLIYAIGRDVTLEKLAEEESLVKQKQITLAELFARESSESKTYFMTKLSHQIRNSLTSIIGYLQLVSNKVYDTEEEHDTYIKMAESSSEEVFTYVTDITDATQGEDGTHKDTVDIITLSTVMNDTNNRTKSMIDEYQSVEIQLLEDSKNAKMFADKDIIVEILSEVAATFSKDLEKSVIKINAQENIYEGTTEIQIIGEPNPIVSEMIYKFKENQTKIIDAIKDDKKDIMLSIAQIGSNTRRMNGNIQVDTFGADDDNLIIITLPLNKTEME